VQHTAHIPRLRCWRAVFHWYHQQGATLPEILGRRERQQRGLSHIASQCQLRYSGEHGQLSGAVRHSSGELGSESFEFLFRGRLHLHADR
jgi:hypothetical protein